MHTGKTHSFLDHTPEPYGHAVLPERLSNRRFHSAASTCCRASMSCWTSNSPPSCDLYTTSSREYCSVWSVRPALTELNGTYLDLKASFLSKGAAHAHNLCSSWFCWSAATCGVCQTDAWDTDPSYLVAGLSVEGQCYHCSAPEAGVSPLPLH